MNIFAVVGGVRQYVGRIDGWHRAVVLSLGALLAIVIFIQLFYPTDRALPLAKIDGRGVGLQYKADIVRTLDDTYAKAPITTVIRGKTVRTAANEAGVVVDSQVVVDQLTKYEWYLRLIPFSALVRGALTDVSVPSKTDELRFVQWSKEREKECYVAPKNAGVAVKNGTVELDPARDGQACSAFSLKQQVTRPPLRHEGIKIAIKTQPIKPVRSDESVKPLFTEAKSIIDREITVIVAGKPYLIDAPTLGSWLSFDEDSGTEKISISVNPETVKAYLETIQKDTYIKPGTTVISTVDSIETGRVTGTNGRGIDITPTIELIKAQVLSGSGTVTAGLATLAPTEQFVRTYSKTPAGLQARINDLAKGRDVAISVRKLGDSGVHANGDKQYHPASTYKLFVAYSVLKRIDDGRMNLGQSSSGGQSVAQCLDNMIVNSDNACAEWLGQTIGWNTLTNEARAIGASKTVLSKPFVSTTNDQALLLQKLESNQLGLSEASRSRLLAAMKRQIFRKGIPAGVGVPVADKVGFLEGYLHDSAIVYSPSGVYVLVIYTNGSSWGAIADIAAQIQAQLQ